MCLDYVILPMHSSIRFFVLFSHRQFETYLHISREISIEHPSVGLASLAQLYITQLSPTLGCSPEISRDIYVSAGRYVRRVQKCVGGITWPKHAHAQSQIWAVKTD